MNPGQISAPRFDQTLFLLQNMFCGRLHVVSYANDLQTAMTSEILNTLGYVMNGFGWTTIFTEVGTDSSGTAVSYLKTTLITQTRHADQK